MQTRVVGIEGLSEAVALLARGDVVAFPTETVYGLGADGLNETACRRIFGIKGRPADNPLILHVSGLSGLAQVASGALPDMAVRLAEKFWPGPLTVVVVAHDRVPAVVRGGLPTVAVRAPGHPVALDLIEALGRPVAAPSANRSGRPSPTRAEDVMADLGGAIPLVVDAGPCLWGVESTVVDVTVFPPVLLRPGALPREDIEAVTGPLALAGQDTVARAPGMKYRHYSPKAPVIWLKTEDPGAVKAIAADIPGRLAWLAPGGVLKALSANSDVTRSLGESSLQAAQRLFAGLRELDAMRPDAIVVVWESMEGLGLAICNRLAKASSQVIEP